jgi:monoterpene epsilon-lactone hydrolase
MANLQTHVLRFFIRRLNVFGGKEIDIDRIRRRTDRLAGIAPVHRRVKVSQIEAHGVPGDWHQPQGAPDNRALLYLHGGAWMIGSPAMYRGFVSRLAHRIKTNALVIDYRLAPEHPFPAGLDDCLAAYDYLLERGIEPWKIVVAGDSAGGNLTLALLVALKDRGRPLPGAAVAISPATDLTGSGESHRSRLKLDPFFDGHEPGAILPGYIGDHSPDEPLISPLFADLHGLPPLLIHVGDHEMLLDDAVRFAEKAQAAGVEETLKVWPEMFHVFQMFDPLLPEARRANREIAEFIQQRLA